MVPRLYLAWNSVEKCGHHPNVALICIFNLFGKQPLSLRAYRHKHMIFRKKKKSFKYPKKKTPYFLSTKKSNVLPWRCRSTWQHLPEPEKTKQNYLHKNLLDLHLHTSHFSLMENCSHQAQELQEQALLQEDLPSMSSRNGFSCEGSQNGSLYSDSVTKSAWRKEMPKFEGFRGVSYSSWARMVLQCICVFISLPQGRIQRVRVDSRTPKQKFCSFSKFKQLGNTDAASTIELSNHDRPSWGKGPQSRGNRPDVKQQVSRIHTVIPST